MNQHSVHIRTVHVALRWRMQCATKWPFTVSETVQYKSTTNTD